MRWWVLATVLGACGGGMPPSTPDAGQDAATPAHSELCVALAAAVCTRAVECYGADYPLDWCLGEVLDLCAGWAPEAACAEDIRDLACAPELVPPCSCGTGSVGCA